MHWNVASLFPSIQALAEMQYRYQEELEAGDLVSELAVQMLDHYGFGSDLLQGPFLLWDWRPDEIVKLLADLVPHNMRLDLLSSTFTPFCGDRSDDTVVDVAAVTSSGMSAEEHFVSLTEAPRLPHLTEPHFGAAYWRSPIPDSVLNVWAAEVADNSRLQLPLPNPFVPTDLSLRELENLDATGAWVNMGERLKGKEDEVHKELQELYRSVAADPEPASPSLIYDKASVCVWHLQDRVFRHPRTAVYLKLATPEAYRNPRAEALTELLARLVRDSLNETTYLASIAELHYSIKCTELGLELHFHGFSDRLESLVHLVLTRLFSFATHLDESRSVLQKEALLRHYANDDIKPGKLSRTQRLAVIKDRMWTSDELLPAAEIISIDDVSSVLPTLLGKLHVDVLIHGNCTSSEAVSLVTSLVSILRNGGVQPLPRDDYPQSPVLQLPEGYNIALNVNSKVESERNSAVEAYWQVRPHFFQN